MIYLIYFGIVALMIATDLYIGDCWEIGIILRSIGYTMLISGLMILNERLKK